MNTTDIPNIAANIQVNSSSYENSSLLATTNISPIKSNSVNSFSSSSAGLNSISASDVSKL